MKKAIKLTLWTAGTGLTLALLTAAYWVYRFQTYTPAEVKADLRAAIGARHAARPVDRYLELRYGPMTEPANRRQAFLDFFNPGHIEGLQIIVRHSPEGMRQSNNIAMAQWVANYRRTMTPEEKNALGTYFSSPAGHARLQQATAQYLRQDVHYRAITAPVIRELLTTVAAVQQH